MSNLDFKIIGYSSLKETLISLEIDKKKIYRISGIFGEINLAKLLEKIDPSVIFIFAHNNKKASGFKFHSKDYIRLIDIISLIMQRSFERSGKVNDRLYKSLRVLTQKDFPVIEKNDESDNDGYFDFDDGFFYAFDNDEYKWVFEFMATPEKYSEVKMMLYCLKVNSLKIVDFPTSFNQKEDFQNLANFMKYSKVSLNLDDLEIGLLLDESEFHRFFSFKILRTYFQQYSEDKCTMNLCFFNLIKTQKDLDEKTFFSDDYSTIDFIFNFVTYFENKIDINLQKALKIFIEDLDEKLFVTIEFGYFTGCQNYLRFSNPFKFSNCLNGKSHFLRVPFFMCDFEEEDESRISEGERSYLANNLTFRFSIPKSQNDIFVLNAFLRNLRDLPNTISHLNQNQPYFKEENMFEYFGNAGSRKDLSQLDLFFDNDDSPFTFETKYSLMCLLTRNKVDIRIFTEDFYQCLEELFKLSPRDFHWALKKLESVLKFDEKRHLTIEEVKEMFFDAKNHPEKLVFIGSGDMLYDIKKVIITPSKIIYRHGEKVLGNFFLRKFPQYVPYLLRVQFLDDHLQPINTFGSFSKFCFSQYLEKLKVCDRNYTYLSASRSQFREGGSWFICTDPDLVEHEPEDLIMEFCDFTQKYPKLKDYPKRLAYEGLVFSSTCKALDLKDVKIIKGIPDEFYCDFLKANSLQKLYYQDEKAYYTDGVGKISEDLMEKIQIVFKEFFLSAIQVRIGGIKGVLVRDPSTSNTIQIRKSMMKFDCKLSDDLNVINVSKLNPGLINKQIIILLLTLGVPESHIFNLYLESLSEYKETNDRTILEKLRSNFDFSKECRDNSSFTRRYFLDNPNDPFLHYVNVSYSNTNFNLIRDNIQFPIKQSARIIGVVDEFGVLEENEVFLQLSNSNTIDPKNSMIVEGSVMIARNPCLDVADIRVAVAVGRKQVVSKLASIYLNVIVFPKKGYPLTAQMSGADLDGDIYFVSWDFRIIPPSTEEIMQDPETIERMELKFRDRFDYFLECQLKATSLGQVDNSHLVSSEISPDLCRSKDSLYFSKAHIIAVDFQKTGEVPEVVSLCLPFSLDFMEKGNLVQVESKTVLGKIYRDIKSKYTEGTGPDFTKMKINEALILPNFETQFEFILEFILFASSEIQKLVYDWEIPDDFEVFSGNYFKRMRTSGTRLKMNNYNLEALYIQITEKQNFFKESLKFDQTENDKLKISCLYFLSYCLHFDTKNLLLSESDNFSFCNITQDETKKAFDWYNSVRKEIKRKMERRSIKSIPLMLPWIFAESIYKVLYN